MYAIPVFKCEVKKNVQKIFTNKSLEKFIDNSKQIKNQLSICTELVSNISKVRNSDEFTLASVTTDTRLNSPVNSPTEEDLELPIDDDLYLDMYKVSGIYSFPQNHHHIGLLNLDSNSNS